MEAAGAPSLAGCGLPRFWLACHSRSVWGFSDSQIRYGEMTRGPARNLC